VRCPLVVHALVIEPASSNSRSFDCALCTPLRTRGGSPSGVSSCQIEVSKIARPISAARSDLRLPEGFPLCPGFQVHGFYGGQLALSGIRFFLGPFPALDAGLSVDSTIDRHPCCRVFAPVRYHTRPLVSSALFSR